jgi:hypothetical protein
MDPSTATQNFEVQAMFSMDRRVRIYREPRVAILSIVRCSRAVARLDPTPCAGVKAIETVATRRHGETLQSLRGRLWNRRDRRRRRGRGHEVQRQAQRRAGRLRSL